MNRCVTIALFAASAAIAQEPRFDVASAKALQGAPKAGSSGIELGPTGVRISGPLGAIIRWAYGLHFFQQGFEISGPSWLDPGLGSIWYDIEGKTEQPASVEQLRRMLRTLLADRFKLSLRRGRKEMQICVISIAESGPKLRPSEESAMSVSPEGDVLHFRGATLSRMDEWLYPWVPYLILDETGLTGRYDFDLNYQRYLEDYSNPGPGGRIDAVPAVNKALQPLGLKAELKHRSVEILVIDHVEKVPTAN
ncbi:MAG: TIGR03435 family protein [Ignavibacteriota bacterium]